MIDMDDDRMMGSKNAPLARTIQPTGIAEQRIPGSRSQRPTANLDRDLFVPAESQTGQGFLKGT